MTLGQSKKQNLTTSITQVKDPMEESVEERKCARTVGENTIISAIVSNISIIPGIFEPGRRVYLMASSQLNHHELESVLNRTLQT